MSIDAEPIIGTGVSNEGAAEASRYSASEVASLTVLVAAGAAVAVSLYALDKARTLSGKLAKGAKRFGELLEPDGFIEPSSSEEPASEATPPSNADSVGGLMLGFSLEWYGEDAERRESVLPKPKKVRGRVALIGSAVTPFAGVVSND